MLGRVSSRAADNLSCHDASKNERFKIFLDSRNLQIQEHCDMFYGLCIFMWGLFGSVLCWLHERGVKCTSSLQDLCLAAPVDLVTFQTMPTAPPSYRHNCDTMNRKEIEAGSSSQVFLISNL